MKLLLQKIQYLGDQESFKQFYQLFFFRLYQFAYSYVYSKDIAEEVVNDVFLSFWQKRKTFNKDHRYFDIRRWMIRSRVIRM
ncbi:MAG: sigma factor [Ginsengibacter sp.]